MGGLNPELMMLAQLRLQPEVYGGVNKQAAVPPEQMGGGAPMDPAMMGAAGGAPMDPTMMGAAGGAPMDPAMMAGGGGMPPMDPAMMGAAPAQAAAAPPAAPAAPGTPATGTQKMKPEQMMQQLSYQLYFIQQQLTALMNGLNVQLPPGALVLPPGVGGPPSPVAALPGGPLDPAQQQPQADAAGAQTSAIQPIQPMGAAVPEKQAYDADALAFLEAARFNAPAGYRVTLIKDTVQAHKTANVGDVIQPRHNYAVPRVQEEEVELGRSQPPTQKIAALAALLRGKSAR
jgi:hypothetical protein